MKQTLKNCAVGFVVSFLGSVPIGYLNVVGYTINNHFGMTQTLLYLLGIVCVEFCIVLLSIVFAEKLNQSKIILKTIEILSVVFMFLLAYSFYTSANSTEINQAIVQKVKTNSAFVLGLILSITNVFQFPFWIMWNLLLSHKKHIVFTSKTSIVSYPIGACIGTFLGMFCIIISLSFAPTYLTKIIIPTAFLIFGIIQFFKLIKKKVTTN